MNKCEKCGGMHWRTAPCVQSKKSTAARKDVQREIDVSGSGESSTAHPVRKRGAGTQALPVDTNPVSGEEGFTPFVSTPELLTEPDRRAGDKDDQPILSRKEKKAAWMREHMPAYMRQYRADVKSGKRVPKPKAEREVK